LPKFQPIESLAGHLQSLTAQAIERHGRLLAVKTEAEFQAGLLSFKKPCVLEIACLRRDRIVQPLSVMDRHQTNQLVSFSGHRDFCNGWERSLLKLENGTEALHVILGGIGNARSTIGRELHQFAWKTEIAGESCCEWLHHRRGLVAYTDAVGSTCTLELHFFVSQGSTS